MFANSNWFYNSKWYNFDIQSNDDNFLRLKSCKISKFTRI